MATTIAVFSIKGGVGKTAASVNLAHCAALAGKRTLLWDLDAQGAASFYYGVKPGIRGGLRDIVDDLDNPVKKRHLAGHVRNTAFDNLDVLPADFSFREFDVEAAASKQPMRFMERILAPLQGDYDYIIVDCPAGFTVATESLLHAADIVLIPTIPTVLSVRALDQLYKYIKDNFDRKPVVRAFFSMMDGRKRMHSDIYDELCVKKKTIVMPIVIPYTSVVERMGVQLAPVTQFAASTRAGEAYQQLWKAVRKLKV
jgi:chromosome partitioning protein